MDAELKLRFGKLTNEEQRLLCVALQWQCLHKDCKDVIGELSKDALEWLVDFESGLIERITK